MQTLFAGHLNKESSEKELKTILHKNVDDLLNLYLAVILYIIKVADYSLILTAKKANLLKKTESHKVSEIIKNKIIQSLQENRALLDAFDALDTEEFIENDIVRQLFLKWSNTERFKNYCDNNDRTLENDKEVIIELISDIFLNSNVLQTHLEEYLMNVPDDIHLVIYTLHNEIMDFDPDTDQFSPKVIKWKSEKEFADDLFDSVYSNRKELMDLVDQKLKNWDLDRVAQMDIILMEMALAELLYFETIPVKVSINEYIDLSKQFSTPKSKEFINGILDTLMKELTKAGRINKAGRGLVEN